jgi:hypothetical protein
LLSGRRKRAHSREPRRFVNARRALLNSTSPASRRLT